ncbi:amidohydrolase [Ensifer adhaerens]|uniref:M20 aminoacylase family protein n=1 Tax=Ensifer adhaerens TaxID=106592 RepID=UPI001CC0D6BC|nr:M20 aminoacylase family protein [Ensifer adhaerens]MBZ7924896.1 amidohydrolase [Ensifer adhaerens]UAX95889.1 amidohydrolase [Ensifer adhaerens]UAY04769.1 amidohydrolase [Ensifer adhaerens]UAY10200.1 amidohydrolase [Ensifer adhaerens]
MIGSVAEVIAWRRELHRIPELLYDLPLTSSFVAERLREFNVDSLATGVGGSGLVATIRGNRGRGKSIGLRADMDALPITEATGLDYASKHVGRMHACGHDGHTAMLLGAARQLSAERDFAGTAVLLFQPAEEGGAGAKAMIDDGVLERFQIDEIYGLHNMPGIAPNSFGFRRDAIMAASDIFAIRLSGRGGHAAAPHLSDDLVLAGASLVQSLQQIVARNVDPLAATVLSVTCFNAGSAENILPCEALLRGTVRSLDERARGSVQERLQTVTDAIGWSQGVKVEVDYTRQYPATVNAPEQAAIAATVAEGLVGKQSVNLQTPPQLASEDFAYFLQQRPGAFVFLGNGKSAPLHNPAYDFNDAIIPTGVQFWCSLMKATGAS